jgi:hypothetical protein
MPNVAATSKQWCPKVMDPMGTGAARPYATEMRHWLDDVFPHSWTGSRGSVEWAPWSLDLKQIAFCILGVPEGTGVCSHSALHLNMLSMLNKIGLNVARDKKILLVPDFSYTLKERSSVCTLRFYFITEWKRSHVPLRVVNGFPLLFQTNNGTNNRFLKDICVHLGGT